MSGQHHIHGRIGRALHRVARRTWRDESGAAIVEFAIIAALFFFLLFSLLDFGRLAYSNVLAQKATQLAARIATVRPAACTGVPDTNERGTSADNPRFGTLCRDGANYCAVTTTISCAGSTGNSTAAEIWGKVEKFLPTDATISALQFSYSHDPNLGFLGGPYTPMVTVSLDLPDFQFVSPLAKLAVAAGADSSSIPAALGYGDFSVSLPGEDLAAGDSG